MSYAANLMESHLAQLGTCQECNKELPDFTLNKTDIDLIKLVFSKTMSDIKDEDLEAAIEETKSAAEQYESIATLITNKSLMQGVAENHPDKLKEAINDWQAALNKVEPIKRAGNE